MPDNIHLFLLVPPRGGSHLLEHVLATSPAVSTMPLEEGEKYFCDIPTYLNAWAPVSCVHGFASRKINYYDDDNKYNWDRIKNVWVRDGRIFVLDRPVSPAHTEREIRFLL